MGNRSLAGRSDSERLSSADSRSERVGAAAIRTAMIEENAARRGGMLSTAGSGGGPTSHVRDGLDGLLGAPGIDPLERPSLDELVGRFGVLPFECAVTSLNTEPHRYNWYGFEVEKGARTATFTLSHGEPADYWMYLVDPSGTEVHPSDGRIVAWNAGSVPYECAKLERPAPGQWLVIGIRLDRGPAVTSRAVVSIEHPEVSVHGRAVCSESGRAVEFHAGATFGEMLTDLSVTAELTRCDGPSHTVRLTDDAHTGRYRACAELPAGAYTGYIEIRAPERPPFADGRHRRAVEEPHAGLDTARAETTGFVRHAPISVVVDSVGSAGGRRFDSGGRPTDASGPTASATRPRRRSRHDAHTFGDRFRSRLLTPS